MTVQINELIPIYQDGKVFFQGVSIKNQKYIGQLVNDRTLLDIDIAGVMYQQEIIVGKSFEAADEYWVFKG